MLDLVTFKAVDMPATNIITNGDFRAGMDDWSTDALESYDVIDGEFSFTPNGEPQSNVVTHHVYQSYVFPNDPSRLYYASAEVYGDVTVQLRMSSLEMDSVTIPFEWQRLSGVRKTSASGARAIGIRDTKNSDWLETRVRRLMFVDLTEVFGPGNEPTAEQMDTLLARFPDGWFDGTKTLFDATYVVGMLLREIADLKDAITSLGGGA